MGESGGYKYSHSRNKIKSHTQVDTQLHIKQWNIPVWIWNEILYCSQTYMYMCKLYFILSKDSFPILFKEYFSIIYFSCKIWLLVQSDHSPTPIGYNMTYSFKSVCITWRSLFCQSICFLWSNLFDCDNPIGKDTI